MQNIPILHLLFSVKHLKTLYKSSGRFDGSLWASVNIAIHKYYDKRNHDMIWYFCQTVPPLTPVCNSRLFWVVNADDFKDQTQAGQRGTCQLHPININGVSLRIFIHGWKFPDHGAEAWCHYEFTDAPGNHTTTMNHEWWIMRIHTDARRVLCPGSDLCSRITWWWWWWWWRSRVLVIHDSLDNDDLASSLWVSDLINSRQDVSHFTTSQTLHVTADVVNVQGNQKVRGSSPSITKQSLLGPWASPLNIVETSRKRSPLVISDRLYCLDVKILVYERTPPRANMTEVLSPTPSSPHPPFLYSWTTLRRTLHVQSHIFTSKCVFFFFTRWVINLALWLQAG